MEADFGKLDGDSSTLQRMRLLMSERRRQLHSNYESHSMNSLAYHSVNFHPEDIERRDSELREIYHHIGNNQ